MLAAIAILPVLASFAMSTWWRPSSRMNHGQLLETRNAALDKLQLENGQSLASIVFKNKWVMLTIQTANCDARCQNKLYLMRQLRTAQSKNMIRLERVWLVADAGKPDAKLLEMHPGLILVKSPDPLWMTQLPAGNDTGAHIYLIDPLGNFVLRYDDTSEPQGMLKDLGRLLKYSTIG